MKKLLLIALSLSTLAACQHTVFLPGSLRQRPDVANVAWDGNIAFGMRKAAAVGVFDDLGSNPPVRATDPEAEVATLVPFPYVDVEIAFVKDVEVYYNTGFGVKWLFLGNHGEQGWRAAVFGGVPNDPWNGGSSNDDCDANCDKARTEFNGSELGLTFGRQVSDSVLLYVTVGKQQGKAKTVIEQTGGTTFTYNDDFEHSVASLGIAAGNEWFFTAELSAHTTTWKKEEGGEYDLKGTAYVLGGGYRW